MDYQALTRLASEAEAGRTFVDPAHESFQTPGNMLAKIVAYARATGQAPPETPGQFIRCCLESLAGAYRDKLDTLETILDRKFAVVHVVGGGGKNDLLCQMTADSTCRRVVVGPYEATALGNALMQAMSNGDIRDLAELRQISARSSQLTEYQPRQTAASA
jgi:rhamnulokinase